MVTQWGVGDLWFPSSNTSSAFGKVRGKIPLAARQWTCSDSGTLQDRDVKTAKNLLAYDLAVLGSSTASSA
ncbi:hypothetical protein A7K73_06950 [Candidatus Methylacidiphilum fumarolicum]|nr:hypothetical protein A7K73_06950 [Candidatus Methylacidiphilum fumarolicum]TFE74144.1 hypothetical protein A7D33_02070 [Candidatus Methylacidiphilum fumarolicum]